MAAVTARKAITFVAVAIGTFVALVILWFPIHGYITIGGECSFEEVECSDNAEFVASDGFADATFTLLIVLSVGVVWLVARRTRIDQGERT